MTDAAPTLRVVDRLQPTGRRQVRVVWEHPRRAPREASAEIDVGIGAEDAEKVRWYLEDYAEFQADPAPRIAHEAEQVLDRLGRDLFTAVFGAGAAQELWAQAVADGVERLRIEVDADPDDAPGLPWELLRVPSTGRPLALSAAQFLRTHHRAAAAPLLPDGSDDALRVLLVICRPGGRDDVPFRSVASRLVRGGADRLRHLDLTVLRPATFARLAEALRAAHADGNPYHVVHFDGHGTYAEVPARERAGSGGGVAISRLRYAGEHREGRHGYLLFENPDAVDNQELVGGPDLANLLAETGVPILVLNACRSAYAEAQSTPSETVVDVTDGAPPSVHDRIRAYGSLAAEIADRGVPGVIAMRYNVYVVTAAQFVADLYAHLAGGASLGMAASRARKALADNATRDIGGAEVSLQDWVVPTVYEAAPLTLLTPPDEGVSLIQLVQPSSAGPDVGFFGRDETLLALDRAFDTRRLVLLHAFAGAGKTSTAREFARWYVETGGAQAVLWTSFEHYTPLERVLDTVGVAFADLLERNEIHWAAITDPAQRRDLVLQVLNAVPVVWVWDNVEPVAGFPSGTESAWTADEQSDLANLLRDLARTRARVLLTSRRDEDTWLGALAHRVHLPPMPRREQKQLARALAPETAPDVDWSPLLDFTGGNPLTITVAVRQAVREDATTDLKAFVARLRAGAALERGEDARLGRDRSLAASLDYGFTRAFTDTERAALAVLHLFRDFVDVDVLVWMGEGDEPVPALAGLTREGGIGLLDRAVEVGLLTGYGGGYYGIHPALPWYFTALHHQHLGEPDTAAAAACERGYARAYAALGRYYFSEVEEGRAANVMDVLRAEKANLLHALALARTHQHPNDTLGCLQGLRKVYDLTGRDAEWARLVDQIQGDYLDPTTDQPHPGRDDDYGIVMEYRIRIAQQRRDWPTTTRLQTIITAWARDRAAPHLDTPTADLDPTARHRLRTLAVCEHGLGLLLLEQGDPGCLAHHQAAYDLAERIGDPALQAMEASSLGDVYLFVPGLVDLDQAQHWHQRSLDLTPEHNRVGRAASHGSLANVAYQRFLAARTAGEPEVDQLTHLNTALTGHRQALDLLPADHHPYRAATHNQLGILYRQMGDVDQSLRHYQQAIQHHETRGSTYGAGETRYNIALLLAGAGRTGDALLYARAALANFHTIGPGAADKIKLTEALIPRLS